MGKHKRTVEEVEPDLCPVDFDRKTKNFDDRLLTTPFEALGIQADLLDCLEKSLNLRHATAAQVCALSTFSKDHTSILLQSHTGTGKTLSFVLPLAERMLRHSFSFEKRQGRPYRSVDVHSIVVSPHKELLRQTFCQCRKIFQRLPFHYKIVSDLDCFLEEMRQISMESWKNRKNAIKSSRFCGGGVVLVILPNQVQRIVDFLSEDVALPFFCEENAALVVDEIDLVLQKRPQIKKEFRNLSEIVMGRKMEKGVSPFDYGFFGATATSSPAVTKWMEELSMDFSTTRFELSNFDESNESIEETSENINEDIKENESDTNLFLKHLTKRLCKCSQNRIVSNSLKQWFIFDSSHCSSRSKPSLKNLYVRTSKDSAVHHISYLLHILNAHPKKKHLVFCNTVQTATEVYQKLLTLSERRILADHWSHIHLFHENLSQTQREKSYLSFIQTLNVGTERAIMVSTDHLAYGIDIRDIEYVVHYDPPLSSAAYFHRVGRTGRMGTKGTSVMLLDENLDAKAWGWLNKMLVLSEWRLRNMTYVYA